MFCIRCGQQIIEGAKFCAYCGAPVVIPVPVKPVANSHNVSTPEPVSAPSPVQEPAPSATVTPVPVPVEAKPEPTATPSPVQEPAPSATVTPVPVPVEAKPEPAATPSPVQEPAPSATVTPVPVPVEAKTEPSAAPSPVQEPAPSATVTPVPVPVEAKPEPAATPSPVQEPAPSTTVTPVPVPVEAKPEPTATPAPVQESAPSATVAPVPVPVEAKPEPSAAPVPTPVTVVPKSKPQPVAEEISENVESDADDVLNTDENKAENAENKEKELDSALVHTAEIPIPVVQTESRTEPISESDGSEPIPVMAASVISAPSEVEAVMTEPSNEAASFGQQSAQSPEQPFAGDDDSEFSGYAEFPSQQSDMQPPEATPVAKNNKPHIAVAVLVSALFGIVIFALFLGSAVLGGTKDTLSEAKLSESVKKAQPLDWVVGDIVLSDAFRNDIEDLLEDNKSQAEMDDFDEDTTLKEFVVIVAGEDKINEDQVEEIAEEIRLLDTIADVVAGYERYFLENDDKEIISTNDIEDMVEDSIDVAQEVSGKTLRINTEKLDEALEANKQTIDRINPSKLLGNVGAITSVALSPAVIIGIFVLAMILVILVGIITKRVSAAAITFGACSFAAGLVLVIVPTIAQIAIEKLGVSFELVSGFGADILGDTLFASYKQYGLLALACGAGVIVAAIAASAVAKAANKKKSEG